MAGVGGLNQAGRRRVERGSPSSTTDGCTWCILLPVLTIGGAARPRAQVAQAPRMLGLGAFCRSNRRAMARSRSSRDTVRTAVVCRVAALVAVLSFVLAGRARLSHELCGGRQGLGSHAQRRAGGPSGLPEVLHVTLATR